MTLNSPEFTKIDASADRDIVNLLKNRKKEGLSLLFDSYSAMLFFIIDMTVRNTARSEALLTQLFLEAWNDIDKLGSSETLAQWLAQKARRLSRQ